MSHASIAMPERPIELIDITPVNPLISKCKIKVCYVGDEPNRNKSIISKEVAKDLANSIPGCPIVGFFNESTGDFEEHNRVIDISNGKFQIKDTTRPYGFVSMDAPVWFQWFEDDGEPHEYLMTEGYIWTGQYPESQRVIEQGNNQSMELSEDLLDAHWTKDNNGNPQFFIINEAIMSKLCILGEDVEPCFEGASITKFAFEDDFKQKLFSLMTQMQEILKEGGAPVFNRYAVEIGDSLWGAIYEHVWSFGHDENYCSMYAIDGIYEENSQKFAILQDRKTKKYYQLNFSIDESNGLVIDNDLTEVVLTYVPAAESQFAKEAVEAYELDFANKKKAEEAQVEEPVAEEPAKAEEEVVEEPEAEEEPAQKYSLEDIEEYVTLQNDYNQLQNTYSELQNKYAELEKVNATLTAQVEELTNFKLKIDREQKKDLIANTFYMLSDDLKKDCIDNIDKQSYDEIEAKLSVICVRNKVSFDLDQPEEKKEPVTYSIDSIDDDTAGLPAWVVRVKEVEKQRNL